MWKGKDLSSLLSCSWAALAPTACGWNLAGLANSLIALCGTYLEGILSVQHPFVFWLILEQLRTSVQTLTSTGSSFVPPPVLFSSPGSLSCPGVSEYQSRHGQERDDSMSWVRVSCQTVLPSQIPLCWTSDEDCYRGRGPLLWLKIGRVPHPDDCRRSPRVSLERVCCRIPAQVVTGRAQPWEVCPQCGCSG